MKIGEKERRMGQFIDSNFEVIEEAISLTEIGSTASGKEASKQDSSIVRILATKLLYIRAIQGHTEGEKIQPEDAGSRSHTSQLEGVCIPSRMFVQFEIYIDGGIHRRRVVKPDTQCSSHHYQFHGVPKKKKKKIVMISRSPDKFTTIQIGSTLKTLFIGSLGGHRRKAQRFG